MNLTPGKWKSVGVFGHNRTERSLCGMERRESIDLGHATRYTSIQREIHV